LTINKIFKAFSSDNPDKFNSICDTVTTYLKPLIKKNMRLREQTTYEEKLQDLITLQIYLSRYTSLEKFLEDIHLNVGLNKEVNYDDDDDYILLSTIHGSKGLEYDYVFLSGASSDLMPSYRNSIFNKEIMDVEEERRLFYVGCSRAKKYLEITLSYDFHGLCQRDIYVSPFIQEINNKYYDGFNLKFPKRITNGNVTSLVNNFILTRSLSPVYKYLKNLDCVYESYFTPCINQNIVQNKCEKVYGTFIDNLIMKMIQQNYKSRLDKLCVPIYNKFNLRKDKHYYNYCDDNYDWRDCLESILNVSCKKTYVPIKRKILLDFIRNDTYYEKLEETILKIIDRCSNIDPEKNILPSMINLHYNVNHGDILGETDIVVGKTIIEIKTSRECICNAKYVLQTIMYRYMLRKRNIRIDQIILFNPLLGEAYILKIVPKWKDTFRVFNAITKKG
jgi:hypothetical protein